VRSNWQVSGGYSWLDARLQGNESVRLAQTPKRQISVWNRYDLSRRLGLGLGVIHQSSQIAAIPTFPATTLVPTRLPAFTRVDAAVFYRVSDTVLLQLNIENLLDTMYFSDAHNNFNISTGAPLNARLTLATRF
jgi:catecholate siderophore receptor